MRERRIRQPGLFDAVVPLAEPLMAHRAETLSMLCILLIEAVAAGRKVMAAQTTEAGDDHYRR
jgi:hypothetical protein